MKVYCRTLDELKEKIEKGELVDRIDNDILHDDERAREAFKLLDNLKIAMPFTRGDYYTKRHFEVMGNIDNIDQSEMPFKDKKILMVDIEQINDLRNGGYEKKGFYNYADMKGNVVVVIYEDENGESKKAAYLLNNEHFKFGDVENIWQPIKNLSQFRWERLSPENDNGYKVILEAAEIYCLYSNCECDPQTAYQILNVITQTSFSKRPYFADIDKKVAIKILVDAMNKLEERLRENIRDNIKVAERFYANAEVGKYNEKTNVTNELTNAGKVRTIDAINMIMGEKPTDGIIDTYAISAEYVGKYIFNLIQNETILNLNNEDYSKVVGIDSLNRETKERLIEEIKIQKDQDKVHKLVKSAFSGKADINEEMAKVIARGIKKGDYNQECGLSSKIIAPLIAIYKNESIDEATKTRMQVDYVKNATEYVTDYEEDVKKINMCKSPDELYDLINSHDITKSYIYSRLSDRGFDHNTIKSFSNRNYEHTIINHYINEKNPDAMEKINLLLDQFEGIVDSGFEKKEDIIIEAIEEKWSIDQTKSAIIDYDEKGMPPIGNPLEGIKAAQKIIENSSKDTVVKEQMLRE